MAIARTSREGKDVLGHGTWDINGKLKPFSEGNILPSTPLTHTTAPHTFRDPRGRSPQETLNVVNSK